MIDRRIEEIQEEARIGSWSFKETAHVIIAESRREGRKEMLDASVKDIRRTMLALSRKGL